MTQNQPGQFGELLLRFRAAAGLSQEELAERAGLSLRGISDLERGKRRAPHPATLRRLVEGLGLTEAERITLQSAARRTAGTVAVAENGAPHGLPNGMVTFLLTDVEGTTRLWKKYRNIMPVALARHGELIEELVARHDGTLVRARGEVDSRFAVFARPSDAVAAASAIQIALLREPWPMPEPLRLRMAIHTGEADPRIGDYHGPAVDHCAQLRSAAHGGQVLISAVTADLVHEALASDVTLQHLGEHRLKDFERPEPIWQVVHPDLPTDFPPLLSKVARPNNLTAQLTPLIGREQELAELQRRLLEPEVRLLTLTGAGGVGKTRLALQVAANLLEHFVDGVFVVPLAAIRDVALVVPTIAQILRVGERSGTTLQQTLEIFLRDKSLLLLLDNFEHVLPAAVPVAELLVGCPHVKVLATSRALLRMYGEHEISVPPLRLPSAPWPPPQQLSQYDAVKLLVERARAVRPNFVVTDETAPAIAAICVRLDGLPLAIELAAARLNLLTPQALLARLNRRFDLLVGGPRDRPPRQQTLSATIQWSFDLLDAQQKALFRRLGVFVGGCTLEAAEWVCTSEGQSPSEVLNGLGDLVDQSLLQQQAHNADDEPRLIMLETVREFALEQLVASGEADAIRRRHVDCFIELGERAALELHAGPEHVRWIARLDRDKHNLSAAMLWCVENGDVERGLQLGGAVSTFWYRAGSSREAHDWQQGLLRLLPGAGHTMPVARALNAAGELSISQSDFSTAKVVFEQSLAIGRELDDHGAIALSLNNLSDLALREGDSGLARRLSEEAVAQSRAAGDRRMEAEGLILLAGALADRREYVSACARFGESAAMYLQLGDRSRAASAMSRQGSAALGAGDLVSAEVFCQESLRLARESGDRAEVAYSYLHLGFLRLHQADYADARDLFVRCLQHWDGSLSVGHCCGYATQGLAGIAASLGQADRAMRLFGAAEAIDRVRWRAAGLSNSFGFGASFSIPHWRALASSALDEQAAAEALSVGRAMSIEQAMAYALGTAAPAQS